MSQFYSQISSWFGGIFGGAYRNPQQIDAPAEDKKPDTQPRTAPQNTFLGGIEVGIGNGVFMNGNGAFIPPPRGSYAGYRRMTKNPTLALVRAHIMEPVEANTWKIIGADKSTSDEWIKEVESQVQCQRSGVMQDAVRFLDYGFSAFEKVLTVKDGRRKIRLKPLLPDYTTLYVDKITGLFAGLSNTPAFVGNVGGVPSTGSGPSNIISPQYSLVLTNDGEAGNLYGTSRMEAAYDTWCEWCRTQVDAAKVRGKIAGVIPILNYPPGDTKINGVPTPNGTIAPKILATIGLGNGVAMPNAEFSQDAIEQNPKLAETSKWQLTFYDGGSYAAAQSGFIQQNEYQDKLLARAWRVRERSVFEGTAGTKAEAGIHTDAGSVGPERIDADIAEQLNRQWVDDILVYNFGDKAKGAVKIIPAPLNNPSIAFKESLLTALVGNASAGPEIVSHLDTKELMADTELPVLETPKPIVQPPAPVKPPDKAKPDVAATMLSMIDQWESGDVVELSGYHPSTDGDGHWITLQGTHVFLTDGVITKGPASFVGKKPSELFARSKLHKKISDKESSFDSAVSDKNVTDEEVTDWYYKDKVPDGWYVHGRADRQDLNTGRWVEATQSLDTADQYAGGKKGSVWYLSPKSQTTNLDVSDLSTRKRIAAAMYKDSQAGKATPSWADEIFANSSPKEAIDKIVSELDPKDIVDSAGYFDDSEFVSWFSDRFDVDFVKTTDGAVIINPDPEASHVHKVNRIAGKQRGGE